MIFPKQQSCCVIKKKKKGRSLWLVALSSLLDFSPGAFFSLSSIKILMNWKNPDRKNIFVCLMRCCLLRLRISSLCRHQCSTALYSDPTTSALHYSSSVTADLGFSLCWDMDAKWRDVGHSFLSALCLPLKRKSYKQGDNPRWGTTGRWGQIWFKNKGHSWLNQKKRKKESKLSNANRDRNREHIYLRLPFLYSTLPLKAVFLVSN